MSKKPHKKRPRDANQLAKSIVDLATMDGVDQLMNPLRWKPEHLLRRNECLGIVCW